jgi:membrane fusion protein, heavy metal efflux system
MRRRGFFVLVLASGLVGCGGSSAPKQAPAPQPNSSELVLRPDLMGIRILTVQQKQIPSYLEVPGRIQADPTKVVRVFPPVGGRLLSMEVRPGDRVKKGQTLARLDSSEVSSARSDYQKARADAEVKQKASQRASLLFEHQVFSEKDYQQAQADAEISKAELERARSRLRLLGVASDSSSDHLVVTAPRAGVVLDIGAAPGEFSRSLDAPAPLCTLADLSTVWAVGDVYEKDMAGLKVGALAQIAVSAYSSQAWNGRVVAISDALDPVTRTAKLRVVLTNPANRLKPEMFATIRLLRSTFSGIAIPTSAILREGDTAYLFVQKSPGHFERRTVTLGRPLQLDVEVTAGLSPGEAVVVEGSLLLRVASQ